MERRARTQAKACATIILLACCPCASALNPSLDINQYAHSAWTIREGFFKGPINAIAQTPDGYLWLGTDFGLLRFDGVRNVPWWPPAGEHLPSGLITGLLAARDGRLWIGTDKGLAGWKDGKLSHCPELAGQFVATLLEDREGAIWAGGLAAPTGRLCAIQNGKAQCYGEGGSLGYGVISLYEGSGANLWAGAATGLWRWKPGPPKLYPMPAPEIAALIAADTGALWIAVGGGIRQLINGRAEAHLLPGVGRQFRARRLLRDLNGGLWIGTADEGLLHVHQGRTDMFAKSDGLSGDYIYGLFEDREGSIWVATSNGLDRFRDFAVPTISVKQGLSNAAVWSVLAARDGSVWLGTRDGLNRWNNGQIRIYRKRSGGLPNDADSLFQDGRGRVWVSTTGGFAYFENGRFIPVGAVPAGQVHSMAGDGTGNLWIGDQDHGLIHLLEGSVVEQIPWARLGRKDFAYALLTDPAPGGLWLGFYKGGLAYFKEGQVRASYAGTDGLGEGQVTDLQFDRDGSLLAATEGGLSRVKNGRVATLTSRNGLPCDAVHWAIEDDDHFFWMGMPCGLVRIARTELDAWATDPKRAIQVKVFDSSDGVRSNATTSGYSPRVAKSSDGKLWFLSGDGVSVVDSRHIPVNNLEPPVHVEEITADRTSYWKNVAGVAPSHLRLPPLVRDLAIDYTACSLVTAEKVRFRVKLEGRDPDWKDMGTERKAFYNDLPPRHYRFRVMACNNSGLWNEAGDSLEFSIDPAYYQTNWFKAACVACFLALLWGLYRYRLHQIAREFNARLEERVGERTRIARELHDTLLQSFQGLMLRFQIALDLLPTSPAKAVQELEKAMERADQAIAEGRDSIHDLRSSTVLTNDLSQAVQALGDELRSQDSPLSASFRVVVEGAPRELHPILRDEIYQIAREAVRNAFRHAQALHIEAEISYGERALRVRVRDDGRGIDPAVVEEGRAGHYGLPGMRERAKRIGAELNVWSGVGSGTEVELEVPGAIAYGTGPARGRWRWRRKHEKSQGGQIQPPPRH